MLLIILLLSHLLLEHLVLTGDLEALLDLAAAIGGLAVARVGLFDP